MLKTQFFTLTICIILGIVMLYLGIQYLFNTEHFLQRMIEWNNIDKDSMQYKYYKNKSNLIFHKMTGIGFLIGGVIVIALPILKLLKYIN